MWQSNVPSEDFDAIVADLYWYCFLEIFRKPTGRKLLRPTKAEAAVQAQRDEGKAQLLDRISRSYGNLFYKVVISAPLAAASTKNHNSNNSKSDGDVFFGEISNAAAQAVYLSMYHAYPRSRLQINVAKVRDPDRRPVRHAARRRAPRAWPSTATGSTRRDQSQIRKSAMGQYRWERRRNGLEHDVAAAARGYARGGHKFGKHEQAGQGARPCPSSRRPGCSRGGRGWDTRQ